MITTEGELLGALSRIELEHFDSLNIEAQTFSEFSAPQLGPTLCAFANLPGGGTILLGVDERSEEMLIGVADPVQLRQQAVDLARGKTMDPAVSIDTDCFTIDGKTVVVINVAETPVNHKPCRYKKVAYKRQFDDDHRMSLGGTTAPPSSHATARRCFTCARHIKS